MHHKGAAILFILSLFKQINTGWIFGFNENTNRKAEEGMTSTAEPERVRKSMSLRDRYDPSEMLVYLRKGKQFARSIFNIYELNDHDSIPSNQNENQNTEDYNSQNNRNFGVTVDESGEFRQQSEVENPATHVTILQPAEEEKDSATWMWEQIHQKTDPDNRVAVKNVEPYDLGIDLGSRIFCTWKCIAKKFSISLEKIKRTVCNTLEWLYVTTEASKTEGSMTEASTTEADSTDIIVDSKNLLYVFGSQACIDLQDVFWNQYKTVVFYILTYGYHWANFECEWYEPDAKNIIKHQYRLNKNAFAVLSVGESSDPKHYSSPDQFIDNLKLYRKRILTGNIILLPVLDDNYPNQQKVNSMLEKECHKMSRCNFIEYFETRGNKWIDCWRKISKITADYIKSENKTSIYI